MSPRFGNTPDAVNNDVQIRAAAGSHHPPNPWPWPTRWAYVGTSCRRGREGYGQERCWLVPDSTQRLHPRSRHKLRYEIADERFVGSDANPLTRAEVGAE